MVKVFSRKEMYFPPKMGEYFRVGKWFGKAIILTPWFVIGNMHDTYKI